MIEDTADIISRDLSSSEVALDHLQSEQSKKQTDGEKLLQMTLEDGSQVAIDEILNSQYETLKWIENAAVDLRYMTEDIERKFEEVTASNQES